MKSELDRICQCSWCDYDARTHRQHGADCPVGHAWDAIPPTFAETERAYVGSFVDGIREGWEGIASTQPSETPVMMMPVLHPEGLREAIIAAVEALPMVRSATFEGTIADLPDEWNQTVIRALCHPYAEVRPPLVGAD